MSFKERNSFFADAPGDASIDGDSSAVAGDDVITLVCLTDDRGNPEGTYKWKKPNGGTQDGKNLDIENLNVDEDDGEYECYVENDVAQGTSATHTLTVNSVPGVERDLDSEKSVVNTDDLFSVSCAFRAKPAASVVWKREDDSALPSHIFSFSSSQEADGKFTITTSTLTWSGTDADARRGQGGKMLCEADNGIRDAVKSNTMDLTIQYAPYGLSITPGSSSVELNEGDDLPDRVCSANCEPSCSFSWHFNSEDGDVVENLDTLSMQNVQRRKHGSYFCKASNEIHPSAHDNFDLIVNYGPEIQEFKTTPQDDSIIESNSTTFSCSVDTRPGASILLTGPHGLSESVGDETELQHTIHDIGCIHSGTYTCTSNNKETGIEVDKTMDIQVKCSPSVQVTYPEDRIHGVTEGASVYFFVEALSHPTPNFQWKRTFNNGTTVNLPSDDSGNKSNLTITNIEMEDFGNYTVSAHNNIGRWEDIKFELRALGRPFRVDDESFYLLVESTVKP
uniref:Ig-like domain-containing protein n=1 Tax=Capitella teleta TaxID=283909 RepID=X1ZS64_CAPTE